MEWNNLVLIVKLSWNGAVFAPFFCTQFDWCIWFFFCSLIIFRHQQVQEMHLCSPGTRPFWGDFSNFTRKCGSSQVKTVLRKARAASRDTFLGDVLDLKIITTSSAPNTAGSLVGSRQQMITSNKLFMYYSKCTSPPIFYFGKRRFQWFQST